MNAKISVLITLLGFAPLTGPAIADITTAVPPTPTPACPSGAIRARMVEKLGLSADQQKSIDDLRARQQAELKALQENKDLASDVRRSRAAAIVENHRAQMRAVLTPEQQQKMDAWRGHRREHAGARRGLTRPPVNPLAVVAMGERIKDRIAEKLQLTDEQRDKLEHIGRAYRAQQREAAKKYFEEMRAVLTPEQRQKAGQWKQHFHPGPQDGTPPFLGMTEGPEDMPEDMAGDPPSPPEET